MEKAIQRYWPVFVLPTLLAFIIGFIWPFIWGVALSFCKFTTVQNVTFVGLGNYAKIWLDDTFTHAFWFTAVFTVVSTVLINVLAFGIALLLTRGIRGTNIFRTTFFMPNLIGGIILGYIWQILLNGVLSALEKPLLSLNATYGFLGLVILMCWQQIGYMMIIYIAGLQNVPLDLIEAAKIDGANAKQILFKITIPMVMPSITICTFLTLTNSFKLFDQNLSLTGGEPAKASQMLRSTSTIRSTSAAAPVEGHRPGKGCGLLPACHRHRLLQLKLTRPRRCSSNGKNHQKTMMAPLAKRPRRINAILTVVLECCALCGSIPSS